MNSSRNTHILSDRIDVDLRGGEVTSKKLLDSFIPQLRIGRHDFGNSKLEVFIRIGLNNTNVDPLDLALDVKGAIIKKYGLSPNHISRVVAEKELVMIGLDYIEFRVSRIMSEMVLRPFWDTED